MTDHTDHLKKKHALFRNFRFHLHMLLTVTNQLINNSGASLGQRQLIQKFDLTVSIRKSVCGLVLTYYSVCL